MCMRNIGQVCEGLSLIFFIEGWERFNGGRIGINFDRE